jgi:hypothetical protein
MLMGSDAWTDADSASRTKPPKEGKEKKEGKRTGGGGHTGENSISNF